MSARSVTDEQLLRLVQDARLRLEADQKRRSEPIAIVGMACRFPGGATDPDRFWQMLCDGVDATSEAPSDRWDMDAYFDTDADAPGKLYVRRGGFLDGIDGFEPEFFGISPREASALDPQQRLLLEVSWEALERTGIAPDSLDGSATGVFVGLCFDDYARRSLTSGDPRRIDAYSALGNCKSVAAGRIAYVLGLQGPVMQLDTSCSSSLVALHLACQSLRSGESDLALAGGVNLMCSPEATIAFCRLHALAPDGRCKTFDASADGYARGEGCGIVVLKRLSDARAARDRIVAVVRGTAVNHDGRSNGLTAPNGVAQERVMRAALANAGLKPADVGYVETHGTGTPLGDPIEVLALARVYMEGREASAPLAIGSVKTNIGHLEGSAGVAGLIKASLMVQRGAVPPHVHFHHPNPRIPWHEMNLHVPTALLPWDGDPVRRAGLSSFGMSGTNAHVIVEAPPDDEGARPAERPAYLLTLSARTEPALAASAARFAGLEPFALACGPGPLAGPQGPALRDREVQTALTDICFTANTGRATFEHRVAVIGATAAELQAGAAAAARGQASPDVVRGRASRGEAPRVAFLFSGQGAQFPKMGDELYRTEPVFRAALDRCADLIGGSLIDVLYSTVGDQHRIHETAWTQPALVAFEYALAELWRTWGVEPSAVLGHSVGELAAACVAGALTLDEALRLAVARGRAMQDRMSEGAMAAAIAPEAVVTAALAALADRDLALAGVNSPRHTVLSGPIASIERAIEELGRRGIDAKRLKTNRAFHSAAIDPALPDLRQAAISLRPVQPRMPIASNVTGGAAGDDYGTADYWCRHARQPVRFADGVGTLSRLGCSVFVEIGPTPVLLPMAGACLTDPDAALLPSLQPGRGDMRRMLTTRGALWVRGAACDLAGIDRHEARRRVPLPTYPFQRRRIWIDAPAARRADPDVHDTGRSDDPRLDDQGRSDDLRHEAGRRAAITAASAAARPALVTAFVRDLLARAIGVSPDDIDLQRPLAELGLDSLMLVALDLDLRGELDIDLPVQSLANGTAASMAEAILAHLADPAGSDAGGVDLDAAAVLDPAIHAIAPAPPCEPTSVLLTGATGFLGAFLLRELLSQTSATVHCLVRAGDAVEGERRIRENLDRYGLLDDRVGLRVVAVPGDLREPRLGLSVDAFAGLADRIDTIYNNAAQVSYVSTYDDLQASHVRGTIELLRLACAGQPKVLHHVSSIAAYESAAYRGETMSETEAPLRSDGIHLAYSQCKWVSEALVRAAAGRGIATTIYRPSLISGDTATGAWNTNDFLCRMLKGIVELGSMPADLDLLLDFSPVDFVSRSLVHLSRQPESRGRAFHLQHPEPLHWDSFTGIVASLGHAVERVPYVEWVARIAASRHGPLYPLLPFFRQRWGAERLTYIELNQQAYRPRLTCGRTRVALEDAGIVCSPLDRALFARYFGYLAGIGFIHPHQPASRSASA